MFASGHIAALTDAEPVQHGLNGLIGRFVVSVVGTSSSSVVVSSVVSSVVSRSGDPGVLLDPDPQLHHAVQQFSIAEGGIAVAN